MGASLHQVAVAWITNEVKSLKLEEKFNGGLDVKLRIMTKASMRGMGLTFAVFQPIRLEDDGGRCTINSACWIISM